MAFCIGLEGFIYYRLGRFPRPFALSAIANGVSLISGVPLWIFPMIFATPVTIVVEYGVIRLLVAKWRGAQAPKLERGQILWPVTIVNLLSNLLLLVLLIAAFPGVREQYTREARCTFNLNRISQVLTAYARDHGLGEIPDPLSLSPEAFGNNLGLFVCPETGHSPGQWADLYDWCDYKFVRGVPVGKSDAVLAFCPHHAYNRVVHADGPVEFVPRDDFEKLTEGLDVVGGPHAQPQ